MREQISDGMWFLGLCALALLACKQGASETKATSGASAAPAMTSAAPVTSVSQPAASPSAVPQPLAVASQLAPPVKPKGVCDACPKGKTFKLPACNLASLASTVGQCGPGYDCVSDIDTNDGQPKNPRCECKKTCR
jgi:hypothetical protein